MNSAVLKATFLALALPIVLGCDPPELTPLEPLRVDRQRDTAEPQDASEPFDSQQWITASQLPSEAWYIQYSDGKRIGYYRTEIRAGMLNLGAAPLIRINRTGRYEQPPGMANTENLGPYTIELESLEYPNGELAEFTERTSLGSNFSEISGKRSGARLDIATQNAEGVQKTRVNWAEGTWGVLGIQSILLAKPMQAGEQRTCRVFVPKLNKILPVELIASEAEITSLPGQPAATLVSVEATMTDGDRSLRSKNWIDEMGVIQKTLTYGQPMVTTFRASPTVARQIADEMEYGSNLNKSVEFTGPPPQPDARSAVYQIDGSRSDSIWDKHVRQTVISLSALSTQLTIHDLQDTQSIAGIPQQKPSEQSLQASPLLQFDHPSVQKLASTILDANNPIPVTPQAKAFALAEGLTQLVHSSEASPAIASALETARRLEGDGPARAVLLVALLRGQGIPAQFAAGLKFNPKTSRFHFHLWTEAWWEGRWFPIDPMTGNLASASCLKMVGSTFSDENPYRDILPVFEAMDRIKIRFSGEP